MFTAETTVVMALMPQVMRVLLEHFGWRGVFFGLGLITLLAAVPFLLVFLKDPNAQGGKANLRVAPVSDFPGVTTGEALRSVPFWILLAANIGGGVTIFGLLPHVVGMMTSRGLTLDAAVGALSLMAVFNAVGQFSSGFVVDKVGTAKIASAFLVLFLIGITLVSRTSAATGAWPLYAGLALMGLGGASQVPMLTYFLTRYFGLKSFAEITGLFRALQAVLTAPAPWLIGVIFDRTGVLRLRLLPVHGLRDLVDPAVPVPAAVPIRRGRAAAPGLTWDDWHSLLRLPQPGPPILAPRTRRQAWRSGRSWQDLVRWWSADSWTSRRRSM